MNRRHRTSSLPHRALLAVLLSALLMASGALAGHSHEDGLAHYADCDICLQVSGLDTSHEPGASFPLLRPATFHRFEFTISAAAPYVPAHRARAPPLPLLH